jgi:hypothetical protein
MMLIDGHAMALCFPTVCDDQKDLEGCDTCQPRTTEAYALCTEEKDVVF